MIPLNVNGAKRSFDGDPDLPLLWYLRDVLGLTGTKFGCGMALCGACTVHLDGQALRSCITPLSSVQGRTITTIKGLGTPEKPHAVQQAYIEEQVPQCGYCVNGWIMTAAALLNGNPKATDEQIRDGLAGLKCRCGTHMSIMRAVQRARALMAETAAT